MTDKRKTVWILGAGFSKPLGGPMLADLLQARAAETIRALYTTYKFLDDTDATSRPATVRSLFHTGQSRRYWTDAEDFLDQIDAASSAAVDAPQRKVFIQLASIVRALTPDALKELGATARRLVAAECSVFVDAAQTTAERWSPYRDWTKELATSPSSHTLVTFNYDRVLEVLGGFDVLKPEAKHDDKGMPQVLKLHGSVDWARTVKDAKVSYRATGASHHALVCADDEIGILTPGPSKQISAKELPLLWHLARVRIHEADAIVFVGYRFPPTDAEARKALLRAIEESQPNVKRHHLSLHIVLGPNLSDPSVLRLEGLLREIMARADRRDTREPAPADPNPRTFTIDKHPLYAEDFFTVWSPDRLHRGPPRA